MRSRRSRGSKRAAPLIVPELPGRVSPSGGSGQFASVPWPESGNCRTPRIASARSSTRELAGLLDELCERFEENTLDVTAEIALRWSDLSGEATRKGRALHPIDGLLCATALAHGLTVATRNETGFGPTGVKLVNPWA